MLSIMIDMPRWSNHPAPFRTKIILLALVSGVLHSQVPPVAHHTWKTYTNVRFTFATCYPEDLLIPQGEAENSDGQTFLAKDGAKLLAYGRNNALNQSLKDALEDTVSRLVGVSGMVTYKVIKPNWFAVAGQNKQTSFYAKTIYDRGQFKSFELAYDSSLFGVYKPVIHRLVSCFADLGH